jgi:hypothetical protein
MSGSPSLRADPLPSGPSRLGPLPRPGAVGSKPSLGSGPGRWALSWLSPGAAGSQVTGEVLAKAAARLDVERPGRSSRGRCAAPDRRGSRASVWPRSAAARSVSGASRPTARRSLGHAAHLTADRRRRPAQTPSRPRGRNRRPRSRRGSPRARAATVAAASAAGPQAPGRPATRPRQHPAHGSLGRPSAPAITGRVSPRAIRSRISSSSTRTSRCHTGRCSRRHTRGSGPTPRNSLGSSRPRQRQPGGPSPAVGRSGASPWPWIRRTPVSVRDFAGR